MLRLKQQLNKETTREGPCSAVEVKKSDKHRRPELVDAFAGDSPLTEEQVHDRAVEALAQEIRLMLDEGVVQAAQDIDLCMLLGAGWPFWLGGITAHLDRTGVSERVTGSRFLPRGVASLPA